MLLQAAGIQTDTAGLAEKEPVLEVLLRRLATAIEAVGRLSRKRWASHIADMGAAEPAAAWQTRSAAPAAGPARHSLDRGFGKQTSKHQQTTNAALVQGQD